MVMRMKPTFANLVILGLLGPLAECEAISAGADIKLQVAEVCGS